MATFEPRPGTSLQARLLARLDEAPDRRSIAFYDRHGHFTWLRFAELHSRAARLGAALAGHGLGRGEVCLIVLPSGELAATLILAVLLLGAVPLLVAPPTLQSAGPELLRILRRTRAKTRARLVICAESMEPLRDELVRGRRGARYLFGKEELRAAPGAEAPATPLPAATDVAALQLTSGTTDLPRVCVWEQRGVLAALDGMEAAMELSSEDVCFNWTPLYHDMGLVNNYLLCLTAGVPLVMLAPHEFIRRPALWLRGLHDTGATVTWSPNFGFAVAARKVRDAEVEGVRLDGVRAFWNAAERIHLHTLERFLERFGPLGVGRKALKTNFGCAENVGGATFSAVRGPFVCEHVDGALLRSQGVARPVPDPAEARHAVPLVSVGRPNPGIEIHILSRTGEALPEGRVGEIALATPSRMRGYLGNARATRRALYGDWLRTGDLGYLRGGELFWVGRVRERITVQGKKLDPSSFEAVLAEIAGLRDGCFVAFGVPDETLGTERVVVASEVRQPLERSVEEICGEIRKQVSSRLAIAVSDVVLVPPGTLAKTSSGKRRHRHFGRLYRESGFSEWRLS